MFCLWKHFSWLLSALRHSDYVLASCPAHALFNNTTNLPRNGPNNLEIHLSFPENIFTADKKGEMIVTPDKDGEKANHEAWDVCLSVPMWVCP